MTEESSDRAVLRGVFERHNERWTAVHTTLCEIPAPAYGEERRGRKMAELFAAAGLADVGADAVGNVYGRYPRGTGPRLAVSAHLDTVFGPEVDVTVHREGQILRAPGICDDAAGLTLLVALAEALATVGVELSGELWFVATVGEESVGNLRGARWLAAEGIAGRRLDAFLTLDGTTPGQVVRHGTWSVNHDLVLHGPGGHAWGDFGVVNPAVALARIVSGVSEFQGSEGARTTINCGILEAGFAPNVIPERAHGHLNLRSESGSELGRLDRHTRRTIAAVVAAVNASRSRGPELVVEHTTTEREGGETPLESPLVRAAVAACQRQDWAVSFPVSSTDANAFMAVGIDAICLFSGLGGGGHTLAEWYDASSRPAALTALADTVFGYFARR